MKNEQFERAKIIKEEIEKCNSVLAEIRKSSGKCFVYRDEGRMSGDVAAKQLPSYCLQFIIDGLYVRIGRLKHEFENL